MAEPDDPTLRPPVHADIVEAAGRLKGVAVRTPLVESPWLNDRLGGRILIKPETLQRTGAYKFRGAYNRISLIDEAARAAGVVAYSSGNHAQAVAAAAVLLGVPAAIVMPRDAPANKLARTRAHGAEVIEYDRAGQSREALAEALAVERGATLVRPYDDRYVIAGQGTVGLEIGDDLAAMDLVPDAVLAPCGGGGLIAGSAIAIKERFAQARLFSVEPEGFDDTKRSLETGARVTNSYETISICDALLAPTPGALTFEVNRTLLSGGLAVDDDAVRAAIATAFRDLKLVLEPGGAVALAAALSGAYDCAGKTVVLIASGGNVDPDLHMECLRAAK